MPDLVVHTIAGYLAMTKNRRWRVLPSVFLLGCIYPDLIRGPMLVFLNLLHFLDIKTVSHMDLTELQILHSPIPLFIQAWFLAYLFENKLRAKVFYNILGGIALHLLLDAGQKSYGISYLWLFPFSFVNPIPGLWWSDNGIWLTLFVSVLGLTVFCWRRKH